MNNIIFKYALKNSFNFPLSELCVTNDEKYNLLLTKEDCEKVETMTIDTKAINTILEKYENKFKEAIKEEIPNAHVLDGYINTIDFKANDKWYNLKFTNLGYYSDEEIDKSEYLSLVFDLLNDLYDELESQVKEVKDYFVLTYEDIEE